MDVPVATPQFPIKTITSDAAAHDLSIGDGSSRLHLNLIGEGQGDLPLCIIIPFDADIPERIEALRRLWRLLQNATAPDQRISPERRDRVRSMIRAVDGLAFGASHREIAKHLYGFERVAAEDWPASSLRYATIRLVRDGQALIWGGYRELLKPSKPDGRRKRAPLAVRPIGTADWSIP